MCQCNFFLKRNDFYKKKFKFLRFFSCCSVYNRKKILMLQLFIENWNKIWIIFSPKGQQRNLGQRPLQDLEVSPRSGLYLLVCLTLTQLSIYLYWLYLLVCLTLTPLAIYLSCSKLQLWALHLLCHQWKQLNYTTMLNEPTKMHFLFNCELNSIKDCC